MKLNLDNIGELHNIYTMISDICLNIIFCTILLRDQFIFICRLVFKCYNNLIGSLENF